MVANHPVFEIFVIGSSTGSDKLFHCMICQRDVSLESPHGFAPWIRPTDPMELSESQLTNYTSRPCKGKSDGFSFTEDLLPACTRVDSSGPLMTVVKCLLNLCRCGISYVLSRRFWGCFRAILGNDSPLYKINWSRAESYVSNFHELSFCDCMARCVLYLGMLWG